MAYRGDTIFALASARGRSGVAVVRLSGPLSRSIAATLCGDLPAPRHAGLRHLRDGGEIIDDALVLAFESGASFTGEDVIEFQVHGSPAVIRRLEGVLSGFEGARLAEPGEFTRRALENGRLDLSQVEGLADVISAETDAQLRQARRIFSGELGRRAEDWRETLVAAVAHVEACIDFADEELPPDLLDETQSDLDDLLREWEREIAGISVAERLRDGFEVAIVGAPNSGKSTLINAIARRDVALTSATPGTTRDIIEVRTDVGGLPVTFLDTAGVHEATDEIERMGIGRTLSRAQAADLRLFLEPESLDGAVSFVPGDLVLHGKCDLGCGEGINVSGKTGEGIGALLEAVRHELEQRLAAGGVATRARHRRALESAHACVGRAIDRMDLATPELFAAELRQALLELDALVGRVDVEEILGHIFASFCIGK